MAFYNTKYLKGDITGGLVAGVVALPLALAFGVQSGQDFMVLLQWVF